MTWTLKSNIEINCEYCGRKYYSTRKIKFIWTSTLDMRARNIIITGRNFKFALAYGSRALIIFQTTFGRSPSFSLCFCFWLSSSSPLRPRIKMINGAGSSQTQPGGENKGRTCSRAADGTQLRGGAGARVATARDAYSFFWPPRSPNFPHS